MLKIRYVTSFVLLGLRLATAIEPVTYVSEDQLPDDYKFSYQQRQYQTKDGTIGNTLDLLNGSRAFKSSNVSSPEVRESWAPDKLTGNTMIVHGIEPSIVSDLVTLYYEAGQTLPEDQMIRMYPASLLSLKQVTSASIVDPTTQKDTTYSACGFVLDGVVCGKVQGTTLRNF